jgi:hypothetical protein
VSVEGKKRRWTVYPKGTKLRVLGHWTGRCAHAVGEVIVAGEGGMSETPERPGHFRGYYHWGSNRTPMTGYTTGLALEPVEDTDGGT